MPDPKGTVTTADRKAEGLLYVKNPISGKIETLPEADARRRIFQEGWKPVDETTGEEIRTDERLREKSGVGEALLYGAYKGGSGGLIDLLVDDPDAKRALRGVEEGSPIASTVGEVAGTVAPFVPKMGILRGTFPGIADAAGQAVTRAIAPEGAGVVGKTLGRAAGMGLEGGAYGVTGELRRAHVEDSPLTAEKLGYGFLSGASVGALLGAPVGAIEGLGGSLGQRYALKNEATRKAALEPGISNADLKALGERELGLGVSGVKEELQHAMNPNIPKDEWTLLNDKGPVGEQVRREIGHEGAAWRAQAEADAATAFNGLADAESDLLGNISGRMKRQTVQRLVKGDVSHTDVDDMIARAMRADESVPVENMGARAANDVASEVPLADAARGMDPGVPANDDFIPLRNVDPGTPANDSFGAATRAKDIESLAELAHKAIRRNPEGATELLAAMGTDVKGAREGVIRALTHQENSAVGLLGDFLKRSDLSEVASPGTWRQEALRSIDSFGKELEKIAEVPRGYTGAKNKEIKDLFGLMNEVQKVVETGSRGEVAAELDFFKKMIGKKAAEKGYLGPGDQLIGTMRRWHEEVRQNLENPLYWGHDFTTMQREVNSLVHKRLARQDRFWDVHFSDAGVPDPKNPWANLKRADQAKIRSAIGKYNAPEHDAELQGTLTHIREGQDMVGLLRKHFEGDDALLSQYEAAAKNAEKSINRAKVLAMRQEYGKALLDGPGGSGVTRGLIGYAIGGPVGAAVGMGANLLMNPGKIVYARAQLERLMRATEGRIGRSVASLLTGSKRIKPPSTGATALAAKGISSLLHTKDPEKRAKEYKATLGELAETGQPGRMEEALRSKIGPISDLVPNAIPTFAGQYQRAAAAVLAMAPVRPRLGLFGEETLPYVSDAELDKFEQVYRGAMDPLGVLEAAADGELTADMVDAADASAPALMGHIRQMVITAASKSPDMEYETKVQLSTLFRVPLDPSMTPEYIGAMQLFHRSRFEEGYGPRSRRTFDETGLNKEYADEQLSAGDRLEKSEVPR